MSQFVIHRGLERRQFLMNCCIGQCDGLERSQLLLYGQWSWNESNVPIYEGFWNESMCTNFLNSSEWSWKESAPAIYEGSWNESMCTNSVASPKWSWKESVCVATLLVALILAVLSVLYGDVVLLYLQLFCLCLGCIRDVLMGSIMNSLLLHSMVISLLSMGVSLGCWVLMGSMMNSPLLHSMGISPLSVGVSLGCWGSLGLSVCQLLGSVFLELGLSGCSGLACCESSPSMAGFFSEMKLKASFSAVSHFVVLALTQSSKVLKEIDLLFVPLWSWNSISATLSMVLKEGALLTSCSISWKETFFLPDLPMGLKEVSRYK